MIMRAYAQKDIPAMIGIWNEVWRMASRFLRRIC